VRRIFAEGAVPGGPASPCGGLCGGSSIEFAVFRYVAGLGLRRVVRRFSIEFAVFRYVAGLGLRRVMRRFSAEVAGSGTWPALALGGLSGGSPVRARFSGLGRARPSEGCAAVFG
jgi:hypothetical protein